MKHSAEIRRKISLTLMGHPVSAETKAKLSIAAKGRAAVWQLGDKNHSKRQDVREKIAKTLTGRTLSPEHKAHISASLKGKRLGKPQPATKGDKNPMRRPDVRAKMSAIMIERCPNRGKPTPCETRAKQSNSLKRTLREPKMREIFVRNAQQLSSDPETIARRLKTLSQRPNKGEKRLADILDRQFSGEWKYVGDGQVILGRKCPDFININGKKLLIELWGEPWHRGHDPEKRSAHFMQYGFHTLILWGRELRDEGALVEKVMAFINGVKVPDEFRGRLERKAGA